MVYASRSLNWIFVNSLKIGTQKYEVNEPSEENFSKFPAEHKLCRLNTKAESLLVRYRKEKGTDRIEEDTYWGLKKLYH